MEAATRRSSCCHCAKLGVSQRLDSGVAGWRFQAPAQRRCLPQALGSSRWERRLSGLPSHPGNNVPSPPSLLSGHQSGSQVRRQKQPRHVVEAAPGDNTARWWEREGGPNVRDVHSIGDFVEELAGAGEGLVVVEFYASWCGSCRALLPKFLKIAAEHPDVTFLKVNFDECKAMCKSLNIKVLPFFHFYRGADGRLDAFSASIAKLAKLREAIETHNTERCSLGPPVGVGPDFDWEATAKANAAAAAAAKAATAH